MRGRRIVFGLLLPLVVVGVGVAVSVAFVRTSPEARREERRDQAPLVVVKRVSISSQQTTIAAQGTAIPAERVVVQPEVGGRVVWQSDELVPGGRFAKGDLLVRIDPRDYRVAVEQQAAQLSRAELDLELERGRQVVAQREWELLDGGHQQASEVGRALALREPQIQTATVAVKAARSGLQKARLGLHRTTIRAPFDSFVQAETVDVGQVVGPQTPLATLVGSSRFWVQVSIPVETLEWVVVPDGGAADGSPARVWQDVGRTRVERSGRVVRLLGDLDPVGGMARVLVEVDDPLGLATGEEDGARIPLLLGAYVHVEIEGRALDDVVEVPRTALQEGDRVFVMNDQDRLEMRTLEIAWRKTESVLVHKGLRDGERIVTSRVPTPIEGMLLRAEAPAE